MARPNKFIINTDYLSIAQSTKYSHNYIIPGGTVPAGGQIIQHSDFTVPAQNGSIDQVLVSLNGGPLKVGVSYGVDFSADCGGVLSVYRISPDKIRAEVRINNLLGDSSVNYPLINFMIKALCFKPPNVF